MLLSRAMRLTGHETVAFVGGGGKTTAMLRLAHELAAGGQVIVTTSTRLFAAQARLAPYHLQVDSTAALPDLSALLKSHPLILVTGRLDAAREGKVSGVDQSLMRALRDTPGEPAVLVEADGSRMMPFKAPADHEPVIPDFADVVLAVVGVDVLGKPLTDEHVHRPELVSELSGAGLGDPITPRLIADVLAHPHGGRKGVPEHARYAVLVNKVESPEQLTQARALAAELLRRTGIEAVLIGAAGSGGEPVQEAHTPIAAVVLAAGASSRMGEFKPALKWRGRPLVQHVVQAAIDAGLGEVVVVAGHRSEALSEALGHLPAKLVLNPEWQTGQSASVIAGLRGVRQDAGAAIFLLVDQPQVSPKLIKALVQRHRETLAPIVAPRSGGRRGNPVLFGRAAWPDLLLLTGDTGGRPLFQKYAEQVEWVDWDGSVLSDLDTMDDYLSLVQEAG